MCYHSSCIGILPLKEACFKGRKGRIQCFAGESSAVARRSLAYVGCDRRVFAVIELFRSFPLCNEMVEFFAESVDGLFCHAIF